MPSEAEQLLEQFRAGGGDLSSGTPQSESESLLSQFRSQSGQSQQGLAPLSPVIASKSPLSVIDRMALSFADDEGREAVLKDRFKFVERLSDGKFAVGNDPRTLQPIDSAGFDGLGDLADVVGEIPIIVGQLVGAAIGTTGGLPGVIAGAGIGAATGQAVKTGIGRAIGVRDQTALEEATDIAITGAFGSLGQGIASGIGKVAGVVGKSMVKKTGNVIDNISRNTLGNTEARSRASNFLAKTFKISANVNPKATNVVINKGSQNIFTKFNMNENSVGDIAKKVSAELASQRTSLGSAVRSATGELIRKTRNNKVIDVDGAFQELTANLKSIGLLTKGNIINPSFVTEGSDKSIFSSLLKQVAQPRFIRQSKFGRFGEKVGRQTLTQFIRPERRLTAREALILRDQFSSVFDRLSPKGQAFMTSFLRGQNGLSSQLANVAKRVGAKKFVTANTNFSTFADALDDLRLAGVNLTKEKGVQDFSRNYLSKGPVEIEKLVTLDSLTKSPILDRIENYAVAQEFRSASPNLLRLGAVAGLVGFSTSETKEGKLASLGGAVLVGSPAGTKILLSQGQRIGRMLSRPTKFIASRPGKIGERELGVLLSRLAQQNLSNE